MADAESTPLGRFLTLADVAEILAISPRQAYTLVRSGELPGIQVGGHSAWRVEERILSEFISARYEEARRSALWRQAQYADVPEPIFARRHG